MLYVVQATSKILPRELIGGRGGLFAGTGCEYGAVHRSGIYIMDWREARPP